MSIRQTVVEMFQSERGEPTSVSIHIHVEIGNIMEKISINSDVLLDV